MYATTGGVVHPNWRVQRLLKAQASGTPPRAQRHTLRVLQAQAQSTHRQVQVLRTQLL